MSKKTVAKDIQEGNVGLDPKTYLDPKNHKIKVSDKNLLDASYEDPQNHIFPQVESQKNKAYSLKVKREVERLKSKGVTYDSKHWLLKNGYICTADIALVSIKEGELCVLLIKRDKTETNIFASQWALPGGHREKHHYDTLETAKEELKEETGLDNIYLEQLYTFDACDRDPRSEIANSPMIVSTVAYVALIDHTKVHAVAGSDADEVWWCKASELPEDIAYDHREIIEKAFERVRGKINYSNFGFELLPEKFTINELREVFEQILGENLDRNNFRTKILKMGILIKTREMKKEGRGQPTPYFKLNREKLATLKGRSLF